MNGADNQNYTYYRTIKIDDLEIFYREAGDTAKPVILLLHGFPSSSHMFRNLIDWLASDYHLIAPDYPGFGYSACRTPENFEYTFDNLAKVIEKFIDKLNLSKITLYMQDYGGPIGFRIAKQRPELINNLIIQNANAFLEGIGPDVKKMGDLQATGDQEAIDGAISYMMSFDGIRDQYIFGAKNTDVISPDSYNMDNYLMKQPGRADVQKVLLKNYATNFPKYPEWQQYLREYQPPALITWGKNDKIFPGAGASAYLQALPGAEVHLFDGGHFLIEEYGKEIATLIRTFMQKNIR
ncbi:alpha/beta fold hydrolase [Mucilaginibacter aquaedulcis]|uniref:alpha/beta fold hydrolase n=1 Tax=Mucilaginibacter aquaedulcis TaxID=1187081 RepID=UPI0025B4C79C|nr:alpha/beta hydrolase [Mucilaginibacter aquaedulcis]MDN3549164.1 alpha/beta hydrolase [Mucilaginibacter aquaedulcis]